MAPDHAEEPSAPLLILGPGVLKAVQPEDQAAHQRHVEGIESFDQRSEYSRRRFELIPELFLPVDKEHPTVLEGSLIEGAAELTAELIAGKVAYGHFAEVTAGREKEIETAFASALDETDLSNWLYNATADKPGDLGYWVGYRIAKTYYQRATDKRQALREILEMSDPKAFLARSGWSPGIRIE